MRSKGIIAKPMPSYWYSYRNAKELIENGGDELNMRILAEHKPYFMIYIYPQLRKEYSKYVKDMNKSLLKKFRRKFGLRNIDELEALDNKTKEMVSFLDYYYRMLCVGDNHCVVNRISWIFENNFRSLNTTVRSDKDFDYNILKSDVSYSKSDYEKILALYSAYRIEIDSKLISKTIGNDEEKNILLNTIRIRYLEDCYKICPNKYELCDIILDICYKKNATKRFAWDLVGDVIIENLLNRNNFEISYPKSGGNEFIFSGKNFSMATIQLEDCAE